MNALRSRFLLAAVLGSMSLAPLAFAGDDGAAGAPPCPPRAGAHPGRDGRQAGAPGMRRPMRAMRAMRFLRALDLSQDQRTAIRDARAAAEPVRKDTFEKIRALFRDARAAREAGRANGSTIAPEDRAKMREQLRAQVKALLEAARGAVAPQAQRLVGSLTTEQRAKANAKAAEHGKTLDDARLLKIFERILLAPGRPNGAPPPAPPVTTPAPK